MTWPVSSHPGVVIGIVKDLDDPKGEGRIRLEFPWLLTSNRSAWAPIAAPLAGKERGAFFMPEPEDEVLVAFEHGDFDHPFVVGFLWNGKQRPPERTLSNRVLVTPGKHALRFEDAEGKRKIILRSSEGHTVTLDDTPGSKRITVEAAGGGERVVLDADAHVIELSGGGRAITMQGGQVRIT